VGPTTAANDAGTSELVDQQLKEGDQPVSGPADERKTYKQCAARKRAWVQRPQEGSKFAQQSAAAGLVGNCHGPPDTLDLANGCEQHLAHIERSAEHNWTPGVAVVEHSPPQATYVGSDESHAAHKWSWSGARHDAEFHAKSKQEQRPVDQLCKHHAPRSGSCRRTDPVDPGGHPQTQFRLHPEKRNARNSRQSLKLKWAELLGPYINSACRRWYRRQS